MELRGTNELAFDLSKNILTRLIIERGLVDIPLTGFNLLNDARLPKEGYCNVILGSLSNDGVDFW